MKDKTSAFDEMLQKILNSNFSEWQYRVLEKAIDLRQDIINGESKF